METIAEFIADRRFAEAAEAMKPESSFARASHEIAMAIMATDRMMIVAVPTGPIPGSACS